MEEFGLRIEVFPADLDRFLDFYGRVLRFQVVRDERTTGRPYAYVQRGGVRIGAAPAWEEVDAGRRHPPVGVEIVLEVDDLDSEYRTISEAGWPVDEPIVERPWGMKDFRLLDPDGHYLRFTTR